MKGIKNKIISVVLAAVLLMGVIPAAYAATPFEDVPEDAWYTSYVEYVYQHNLMEGTSDTTFRPNNTMTRAMFVTVLYRVAGEPAYSAKAPFTDVPENEWYYDAVNWAYENKIIEGVTDIKFAPMSSVLREQMVAVLFRYCKFCGLNWKGFSSISSYDDAVDVSGYSGRPFGWALHCGIINGTSDTTLSPKHSATRAQCAAILQRYVEWSESEDAVLPVEPTDPTEPSEPVDPDPTEPVDPEPTEPSEPDPTEPHVHEWVHHHYAEEGHYGELKLVCTIRDCNWCCTESQAAEKGLNIYQYWTLYHQNVMDQEDSENQHSYYSTRDWVVDKPAYDVWTCYCGASTDKNPNP